MMNHYPEMRCRANLYEEESSDSPSLPEQVQSCANSNFHFFCYKSESTYPTYFFSSSHLSAPVSKGHSEH